MIIDITVEARDGRHGREIEQALVASGFAVERVDTGASIQA